LSLEAAVELGVQGLSVKWACLLAQVPVFTTLRPVLAVEQLLVEVQVAVFIAAEPQTWLHSLGVEVSDRVALGQFPLQICFLCMVSEALEEEELLMQKESVLSELVPEALLVDVVPRLDL